MLLTVSILLPSCKNENKDVNDPNSETAGDTLPSEFVTFFDRFHKDSAFQMDHITFPLEGLPNSNNDSVVNNAERYYWTRADWKLHRGFVDPSQQFTQWFEMIGDRMIEHWVHMKGTNLFLQRRFAKLSDGWYLIYYAGMRPRSEKLGTGSAEQE